MSTATVVLLATSSARYVTNDSKTTNLCLAICGAIPTEVTRVPPHLSRCRAHRRRRHRLYRPAAHRHSHHRRHRRHYDRRRYDRDQRQLQAPPKLERAGAGDQLATNMVEGAEGSSRAIVRDEHEARRRKKGKRKLKEPREEERKVKKEKKRHPYMCKHCNEEFSTHQALGGHMAGHHKEKRILLKEKQRERSLVLEKEPERSHHLMEEKHPERGLILEKKQLERSSIVLKEKQPDKNLILEEEQPEVVYQDKIDQTMNWQKTERNEGVSYLGGGSNTAPIAQEDSRPPFGFDLNVEAPEQE
ncbi:hypothetical protein DAI22_06g127500 [Oryza sativa Japonica Group]|nr:hypothetical protein DAI22_06g127500 [Oryza sativa Japonica Group]